ncbi:hypothetical protein LTR28_011278, partial [Elasticomyces elasticus]
PSVLRGRRTAVADLPSPLLEAHDLVLFHGRQQHVALPLALCAKFLEFDRLERVCADIARFGEGGEGRDGSVTADGEWNV